MNPMNINDSTNKLFLYQPSRTAISQPQRKQEIHAVKILQDFLGFIWLYFSYIIGLQIVIIIIFQGASSMIRKYEETIIII